MSKNRSIVGNSSFLQSSGLGIIQNITWNQVSEDIVLSLWWDNSVGSFKTRIRLGDNSKFFDFNVIPDTGSNTLIITGKRCSNCNPREGVWDPSVGQSVGENKTITYGGGQTTTYTPWSGMLYTNSGKLPVNFGVITSSSTPEGSPQNVLGLQSKGFLSSLSGSEIPKVTFDFIRGQLIISPPPNKRSSGFLLNQPLTGTSFEMVEYPWSSNDIKFVTAKLSSMSINGKQLPDAVIPHYVLFDTGTTFTIVSKKLEPYFQSRNTLTLTFSSGVTTPNKTFVFNPPENSVRQEPLRDDDTILIGNLWLRDHVFVIDYPNNQITLS